MTILNNTYFPCNRVRLSVQLTELIKVSNKSVVNQLQMALIKKLNSLNLLVSIIDLVNMNG